MLELVFTDIDVHQSRLLLETNPVDTGTLGSERPPISRDPNPLVHGVLDADPISHLERSIGF